MEQEKFCPMVKIFNDIQLKILERHIEKHIYFHRFTNKTQAQLNFIQIFAPIEREVFCAACKEFVEKNCNIT